MVGGKKVQSSNTRNIPVEEINAQEKHVIIDNAHQDTGYVSIVMQKMSRALLVATQQGGAEFSISIFFRDSPRAVIVNFHLSNHLQRNY